MSDEDIVSGSSNGATNDYDMVSSSGKNIDYDKLTRAELIDQIRKLKIHVQQLRNVIRRDQAAKSDGGSGSPRAKKARKSRPFDFSKHPKRHVALKIAYLGWNYHGLAVQEDTDNTIESHMFDALIRAKLIQDRATSNYHRCGRTDKGVSAFCQVMSIDIRSKCNAGLGVTPAADSFAAHNGVIEDLSEEIDYCKILNAILPKEIRVIAWSPVRIDFSARFDCKERVYRYYVPRGNANVEAMQVAAQYLVGSHDFQNFCKPDTSGDEVKPTIRRFISFDIRPCSDTDGSYDVLELEIRGQSFLWHQIRCIVSVLILVGQELESPDIVKELLDLEKYPKKPQYAMAADFPLVLFETSHGDDIETWICNPENYYHVIRDLQSLWAQQSLKGQMILQMLKSMQSSLQNPSKSKSETWVPPREAEHVNPPSEHFSGIIMGTRTKVYKPLRERPVCGSSGQD